MNCFLMVFDVVKHRHVAIAFFLNICIVRMTVLTSAGMFRGEHRFRGFSETSVRQSLRSVLADGTSSEL